MAENSAIEWTNHTFNPWVGCQAVSPACDNCYAKTLVEGRMGGNFAERRRTSPNNWNLPLRWNRRAEKEGRRYRVFCASLADVFDNQVSYDWRAELWRLIAATPHLDWLLLTKRPQNIAKMLPAALDMPHGFSWPLPNVWLGTTVENQEEADRRIPHLLAVEAKVHFLSCEPLVGPVLLKSGWLTYSHPMMKSGLDSYPDRRIDWIIAGGESGPKARPPHPNWFRSLRDQCKAAGVPFFFKQWGEWLAGEVYAEDDRGGFVRHQDGSSNTLRGTPDHWWSGDTFGGVISSRVGKSRAGRLLDGREHNGMPGQ